MILKSFWHQRAMGQSNCSTQGWDQWDLGMLVLARRFSVIGERSLKKVFLHQFKKSLAYIPNENQRPAV
jgi:hypothetical protein